MGDTDGSVPAKGTFEYCLCLVDRPDTAALGQGRAAFQLRYAWNRGATIRIRFVEVQPRALLDRIEAVAREWITRTGINLKFQFVDSGPTDIRISFSLPGAWSYVGTDCTNHPNLPTMNFEGLHEGTPDADLRRVVLHEFGHALGLVHEHQHPDVTIPWDREAVYRELSAVWNKATIDANIFEPYDERELDTSAYDARSIMHYPVPKRWMTTATDIPRNDDLSDGDIAFVTRIYR